MVDDAVSPGVGDRNSHGAPIERIGAALGETRILEPIDQCGHAGLGQSLSGGQLGDPQRPGTLKATQRTQGACRQTRGLTILAKPGKHALERLADRELTILDYLHSSSI